MRFLIQVMIIFGIVLVALSTIRSLISPPNRTKNSRKTSANEARSGKLVKDPICGTYVTQDQSISVNRGNEVFHFCSNNCREQFLTNDT